ncbi:hypothetical protein [Galbitalea soli]|uniref:Uncharacterized protein n=1 Tax=Galbitalea soli TaxID=1268042 RepID=A0A7C9PPQ6_9MICO|nr:hypothetical protein [Galbitalea soli]NEM92309.1 hypothetical protein [Galbitalea soli]NYJ31735.1 hypothetical protein [Galbitalea soli]
MTAPLALASDAARARIGRFVLVHVCTDTSARGMDIVRSWDVLGLAGTLGDPGEATVVSHDVLTTTHTTVREGLRAPRAAVETLAAGHGLELDPSSWSIVLEFGDRAGESAMVAHRVAGILVG